MRSLCNNDHFLVQIDQRFLTVHLNRSPSDVIIVNVIIRGFTKGAFICLRALLMDKQLIQ